ncbi:MAG: hypothetical protein JSR48_06245 [Verrucomicrobia bacterium]|nr:hypothetical protein [Verrucomicrobiota bacterium]
MQLSYEVLNVLLFLCPGLLASTVLRLLVYRKESSPYDKVVSALLWSLLIYALCALIGHGAAVQMSETKRGDATYKGIVYSAAAIFWLLGMSLVAPTLLAFAFNRDLVGWVLRKLRITSQSARATIWLDVFAEYRRYVVVHFADGRRVYGWVMHYSNSAEDGNIYLYEPQWLDDQNKLTANESHGLFLVKRELIDFIEFLKSPDELNSASLAATPTKDEQLEAAAH